MSPAASPAVPLGRPPAPASAGPAARAELVRQVWVARQAVHDARRQVVAYQLMFRGQDGARGGPVGEGEQATTQVIASTLGTFGLDSIADGRPAFVNFTRAFLTGMLAMPVGPDKVVLEVAEQVSADRELLLGLSSLREAGYRIALHDGVGQADRSPLLEVADFVRIDVSRVSPGRLPGLVRTCRQLGSTLIAATLEDQALFDFAVDLGFDLFQGGFLQRPNLLQRRTLTPSQLVGLRLLSALSDADTPTSTIERLVGSDPGLTLRLLRSANSGAAAPNHEVTSLRQALVLLGPRRLRSWVVLTLLEGSALGSASDDLWRVLARAFACERLADAEGDLAFTVGLLSGAAEMLGATEESVADGAGLREVAKAALVGHQGAAGHALAAVLAHEHEDAEGVAAAGLLPFDVSRAYLESLSASLELVHDLMGAPA